MEDLLPPKTPDPLRSPPSFSAGHISVNFALRAPGGGSNSRETRLPGENAMHASLSTMNLSTMELPPESPPPGPPPADSRREAETKRAIRELLDVLTKERLAEVNRGAIHLQD